MLKSIEIEESIASNVEQVSMGLGNIALKLTCLLYVACSKIINYSQIFFSSIFSYGHQCYRIAFGLQVDNIE